MEIQKMNPEVKQAWLDALRSGAYEQTQAVLRDGRGYCCLGVLCDLHNKATDGVGWDVGGKYSANDHTESEIPPPAVWKWAGLGRANPAVAQKQTEWGPVSYTLAELNDDGKTFAEIADIIEEKL